jgi:glucosamine 6-phosphate synthetase-like amidotransferase/phosphosugar isomerase protein
MCGIAGFSLTPQSRLERTLLAQTLLTGIAERGADAVGYAYRTPASDDSTVIKQQTPASQLLEQIELPPAATELLVHVRDYTKGHPSIAANNHPVAHGPIVGIHNGIILNDDALLAEHDCARLEPGMTVDSEAIFALAAHSHSDARALESLHGAMAAAWLDRRQPRVLHLARSVGRPLWLGYGRDGIFFASTENALRLLESYCGIKLRHRELREGTLLALEQGRVVRRQMFRTRAYIEDDPLPAVRAPQEREFCLARLAVIAHGA